MGIEATAGGGYKIGRNRRGSIFFCQLFDIALNPLNERLASRPQIRPPGICCIIGSRNGLRGIVGVRSNRSRRATMEIPIARELLADECGTNDLAVSFQQAAVRLIRERNSRDTSDYERVNDTRDQRERYDKHNGRANFL